MNKVIVYTNDEGNISVCYPTGEVPIEIVQQKDIPKGKKSFIVDIADLPSNHNDFFNAWEQNEGIVFVNIDKAKEIAHNKRREARDVEFKPLDEVIMKQIPGINIVDVEASRQVIRDKYAEIQDSINAAGTVDEIKGAMKGFQ